MAKMMDGSDTSASYLAFARKGQVVLGIKPVGIMPGSTHGAPGCVYFAAKLRSAPAGDLFAEEDAAQSVVKFQKNPANLWDAWPNVTKWDNKNSSRASTVIGVFAEGKAGGSMADAKALLKKIETSGIAGKWADYLVELAGPDNVIATREELVEWVQSQYVGAIQKHIAAAEKQVQAAEEVVASVGTFGILSEQMAKIYKSHADKYPDHGDSDDGEDADGDDDNGTDD